MHLAWYDREARHSFRRDGLRRRRGEQDPAALLPLALIDGGEGGLGIAWSYWKVFDSIGLMKILH